MRTTDKSAWSAVIQQHVLTKEVLPDGPGWYTFTELQEALGLNERRMYAYLQRMKSQGLVDVFRGFVRHPTTKRLVRQVFYRLKNYGKSKDSRRK
jgi:DNA-binding transcriptional regulator PaaX